MLYLDVTSSCKSPMNTGVQRVVRAVHRAFRERMDVQPMIWDDQIQSYCRLSTREKSFLERSQGSRPAHAAEPEHAANPWPWSRIQRHLEHRLHRLDPPRQWQAADALFVPEIFQDHRLDWLRAVAQPPGVRRVALFYDAITWRQPELSPPRRQERFQDYLRALAGFDEVLAISEESAADLRAFWQTAGVPDSPTVTVHPICIDEAGGTRPPVERAAEAKVLCGATLEARKNHLALLTAAERLWREGLAFDLDLIGRTTRHWGGRVTDAIDQLKAADRPVHWHRHVDESTLARAYRECRFTVFPSLVEGFGLPILESLWHGKPCICGDRGAIAETAGGGGCRMVDVTSVDALTDAMRELLTSDEAVAQLSDEATSRQFPTWREYAAGIESSIFPRKAG
jgi:glycosyltransferase involved in cell wall biosynthesis